jgi:GNAT superfamily N-acetyltransferase
MMVRERNFPMLAIRPAVPGDEALVLSFIRALAEYEKLLDRVVATEESVREALFGEAPRLFCDIAEWDGKPAGFTVWFYNYSTFLARHGLYIEDLFVKPEYRNKGIGKALLVNHAARAVAEGCGRLEWMVLDWNSLAIEFYEILGAREVDGWSVYRVQGEALAKLAKG